MRKRMSTEDRAKQFMPFAALKGYEKALKKKEKVIVPRAELSEEAEQDIDRALHLVRHGDMLRVIYYFDGEYISLTGMVSGIDFEARTLRIVNTVIPMGELLSLENERDTEVLSD